MGRMTTQSSREPLDHLCRFFFLLYFCVHFYWLQFLNLVPLSLLTSFPTPHFPSFSIPVPCPCCPHSPCCPLSSSPCALFLLSPQFLPLCPVPVVPSFPPPVPCCPLISSPCALSLLFPLLSPHSLPLSLLSPCFPSFPPPVPCPCYPLISSPCALSLLSPHFPPPVPCPCCPPCCPLISSPMPCPPLSPLFPLISSPVPSLLTPSCPKTLGSSFQIFKPS